MSLWESGAHEVTIRYPLKSDTDNNCILPSEKDKVVSELNKTVKTANPVEVKWKSYDPESDLPVLIDFGGFQTVTLIFFGCAKSMKNCKRLRIS